MSINILFASRDPGWDEYEIPLGAALRAAIGPDFTLSTDLPADRVDYIVYAPNSTVQDFTNFPRLRAVLSLWAGVERIVGNQTLTVPLTRMVDAGLTEGMVEYVTGHVLRYHLGMDAHIAAKPGDWLPEPPPLARSRPVGILGLGALGQACAQALSALNFPVTGWSRSPKNIPGLTCRHGADGLAETLRGSEILVLLLPDTAATENVLNPETLVLLPEGARIVNPGRGTLIDDSALLDALDSGQIGHATLDVFRAEPLRPDHPYWTHPNVTVTPHIASATRPQTAAAIIAENIRLDLAGEPLLHLVDRKRGY